jgi:trans-AT polyketide synthase/acyltransferase/oxidoreductase domain-containing protein
MIQTQVSDNALSADLPRQDQIWSGDLTTMAFDENGIYQKLLNIEAPVFVLRQGDRIGTTNTGGIVYSNSTDHGDKIERSAAHFEVLANILPLKIQNLGDARFKTTYGTHAAYMTGAMAHGIASVELVIALGKAGLLGSFGSAGIVPARLERFIQTIQSALPDGPYAVNLIYNPNEEALERGAVDLLLKYNVTIAEASAYLDLSPSIVYYRAAGLSLAPDGTVIIKNRVIAKLSRKEIATKFMSPAPEAILNRLLEEKRITSQQAELAKCVPMADDITVEADSGGHTDNRPLVCLMPTMLALRDELQAKYGYRQTIRVGAAGGISTPAAALAAFMMGAAYIVTGTVNQACVEAGTSEHTRKLLAQASMTDVIMAPSADMFELGVKVQVLKSGTLFPMRAMKLYDLYTRYSSIDEIPGEEREKLEKQVFKRDLVSIWQETEKFFTERDPDQIIRANQNPKRKMALIFRWYLGLSSLWSNSGEKGREMDYQIWCGPSIGPFNDWSRGTYLADPANRKVVDVALHILTGCAYLFRLQVMKMQGIQPSAGLSAYRPLAPITEQLQV